MYAPSNVGLCADQCGVMTSDTQTCWTDRFRYMFILHAFILASDVIDQMPALEPSVHLRYVMYTDDEVHDERSILGAVLFTNRIPLYWCWQSRIAL